MTYGDIMAWIDVEWGDRVGLKYVGIRSKPNYNPKAAVIVTCQPMWLLAMLMADYGQSTVPRAAGGDL